MYVNCRLCASKIKSCHIKFSNKLKNDELGLFVYKYLDIKFIDNDQVPNVACDLCCQVLTNFTNFLKKLRDAQQQLRETFLIPEVNIIVKSEQECVVNDCVIKTEREESYSDSHDESYGVKTELDYDIDNHHFGYGFGNESQGSEYVPSSGNKSDNYGNVCHSLFQSDEGASKVGSQTSKENSDSQTNLNKFNKVRKIEFKCHKCDLMVQTNENLQDHFKTAHNCKTEYVCLKCKALFDDFTEFEKHLYDHYLRRITKYMRFSCKICGKKFKNKTSLTAHEDIHLGIKRFSCNECGRKFRLKHKLTDHEFTHKTIEKKDFKVKCTQCDKICNSAHLLERHMRTHIPNEEKYKYQCEKCDRKFVSMENYNNHQKLHENEKEKEHICDHCGKNFKNKGNFLEHVSLCNSTENPFVCDQCPKSFKTDIRLKRHKLIHSGTKPYSCEICGKEFRTKRNLEEHSSVHSEEVPFECNYCHKRFKRRGGLEVHVRQHTGERPFSCLECNHYFSNNSNFLKHLKGKHKLKNVSIRDRHSYPFTD